MVLAHWRYMELAFDRPYVVWNFGAYLPTKVKICFFDKLLNCMEGALGLN